MEVAHGCNEVGNNWVGDGEREARVSIVHNVEVEVAATEQTSENEGHGVSGKSKRELDDACIHAATMEVVAWVDGDSRPELRGDHTFEVKAEVFWNLQADGERHA